MVLQGIKKALAAGLAASGLAVATGSEAKAAETARPTVTERVLQLRDQLAAVEAREGRGAVAGSARNTWVNFWTNWGNWGNWSNFWNNWRNCWTNFWTNC